MGKKNGSGMYNQERNEEVANHLEAYLDAVDSLFILEGKSEDEIKKAKKVVKKAIKNLRAGKPEKVYDADRFEDSLEREPYDIEDDDD
jgi:hypothetical protein